MAGDAQVMCVCFTLHVTDIVVSVLDDYIDVVAHVPGTATEIRFRRLLRNGTWLWLQVTLRPVNGEIASRRGVDSGTEEDLDMHVSALPMVAAAPHLWGYT